MPRHRIIDVYDRTGLRPWNDVPAAKFNQLERNDPTHHDADTDYMQDLSVREDIGDDQDMPERSSDVTEKSIDVTEGVANDTHDKSAQEHVPVPEVIEQRSPPPRREQQGKVKPVRQKKSTATST